MSWVRLDDGFFDNPKILNLSDAAQLAHVKAITYCCRNLTDGELPMRKARDIASPKALQELVPRLWEPTDTGFQVHDFLEYNPTRAVVLSKRASDSARKTGGKIQDSKRPTPILTPNPLPIPDPVMSKEESNALFERANRVAANPTLDTSDDQPFVKAFRERFQQREGKDPPRNQVADARSLEREFGHERCLQIAADYDWSVAPAYLRSVLEGKKHGNGSGESRSESAAAKGTGGVADRVPGLDRRRTAIAERRRNSEQAEAGLRPVGA